MSSTFMIVPSGMRRVIHVFKSFKFRPEHLSDRVAHALASASLTSSARRVVVEKRLSAFVLKGHRDLAKPAV